ncbi:MAG: hypothetical protein QNI98_03060 [Woeseiaceae bacterium]|nr:hypothetical protein [Woeseiaceae bacterium]
MNTARVLPWYYAATVLFLILDYGFGINIRVAFLDAMPVAKFGYYIVLIWCFGLVMYRPAWATLVGTFESLVTLIALILGMGMRVMIPNDVIFAENAAIVTVQEVINFVISGSMAYLSWVKGLRQLVKR